MVSVTINGEGRRLDSPAASRRVGWDGRELGGEAQAEGVGKRRVRDQSIGEETCALFFAFSQMRSLKFAKFFLIL